MNAYWFRLLLLDVFCLICLFPVSLIAEKQNSHISDFAAVFKRPPGAPKQSDICFSSRWPRPIDSKDRHDTFQTAKRFHATRIDWSYSNDTEFIKKVKDQGLVYFGTISSEMEGIGTSAGREKNYKGELLGNPELDFLMARGDVNSTEYRDIVMKHLKILIDGGADGIQFDDPGMTYHNTIYLGGGYGDNSLRLFRSYLKNHSTPAERTEWGITEDPESFDYASFVRQNDGESPKPLRKLFEDFHRASLDQFYRDIHKQINQYAGRQVPFSCNNWSVQKQKEFPFKEHFDFWVGETSVHYGLPTAKRIYDKTKTAEALGKVQVFSPPNDGLDIIPTREEYIRISRKLSASSYACGTASLIPWDVWRRGPKTPRFFGTYEEFGDLYDFISDHQSLYENHEEVFSTGAGVSPQRAKGLSIDPASIKSESGSVLLTVRAVPKDHTAPVVVHLVDWSEEPKPSTVTFNNELFGLGEEKNMSIILHLPGETETKLSGTKSALGETVFSIPPLKPYGLLEVSPKIINVDGK